MAARLGGVLVAVLLLGSCSRPTPAPQTSPLAPVAAATAAPAPSDGVGVARPFTPSSPSATTSLLGPVFLLVMENKEYGDVVGNSAAPYLNQLAVDNTLVDQSYAIAHPSLPNYLALLAGDTFGITSDCTDCFLDRPNLVDALEARGRSWKAYMEGLPAPCFLEPGAGGFLGVGGGGYALKHNPFLYFQDIRTNPARCNRVVPLSQLDSDLASGHPPDFVWITPNLEHDTHDASVADGDRWLAAFIPRLLASPAWGAGTLLIITWDEGTTNAGCCGLAAGGHVPTVLVQAGRPRGGHVTDPATHYSVLRTIEDALQVDRLGQSAPPGVLPLVDVLAR